MNLIEKIPAAEAICFVEAFVDRIQWPSAERETQTAVLTLCWNLKAFGPQLEIFYKGFIKKKKLP